MLYDFLLHDIIGDQYCKNICTCSQKCLHEYLGGLYVFVRTRFSVGEDMSLEWYYSKIGLGKASFKENTRAACCSEICANRKHVSDWHCLPFWKKNVPFWNMHQIGALCKCCHIEGRQQFVLLTYCIWSNPTFITEKETNKSAVAWPYF